MEAPMRSAQGEMDLEEWELLPKNGFNDLDQDEDHLGAVMMDYILCPSTQESPRSSVVPTKLLQVPIAWEPVLDHESKKTLNDPDLVSDPKQTLLTDSVPSPRVSFMKTKETEFADMKIDPPARITSPVSSTDAVKPSDCEGSDDLREKKEVRLEKENDDDVTSDPGCEKLNLWKIGLNGIGTICSFGVAAAAATVCVLFLGHNNIKVCKNKNQSLRFQIYSDDNKRMKEVVNHGTKLNEAIFTMKDVPVVRAQISFGGYYDDGL